jgi:predicted DNA-binding transcriptional regulator YafY
MDQLIRQKRTGNSFEFAEKIGISRRQLYNWLNELKSFGLDIAYDRERETYYYTKEYKIRFNVDVEELNEAEATYNTGGFQNILKKHFLVQ